MLTGKLNENVLTGVPTGRNRSAGWGLADVTASWLYERGGAASSSVPDAGAVVAPLEVGSSWAKLTWAAALAVLAAFLSSLSD